MSQSWPYCQERSEKLSQGKHAWKLNKGEGSSFLVMFSSPQQSRMEADG